MIINCVTVSLPTKDYCKDFFVLFPLISYTHINLLACIGTTFYLYLVARRFTGRGVEGRGRVEGRRTNRSARQLRMRMSVQVKSESASEDDARKVGPGPFLDWTYAACLPQGSKYVSEVRSIAPVIGNAAN